MFDDSKIVFLQTTLQGHITDRARTKFLEVTKTTDLSDQEIYDHAVDCAFAAVLHGDPTIEIETSLVLRMLLSCKAGLKRPRGGQKASRQQKIRKQTLVCEARRRKAELVSQGESATQARHQATEEAEKYMKSRRRNYSAEHLARQMQETDKPRHR